MTSYLGYFLREYSLSKFPLGDVSIIDAIFQMFNFGGPPCNLSLVSSVLFLFKFLQTRILNGVFHTFLP